MPKESGSRPWMRAVLIAAGICHAALGFAAAAWPLPTLALAGMDPAGRAGLWQAFGVAAGVFGLAYVAAASDPLRHWPVVGAGLVGTVLVAGGVATAGVHSWIVWLAT